MEKINYKLINFAIIIIIFFFIIQTSEVWLNVLNIIKKITLPIIIAFVISYSLYPLVNLLKKKIKNNIISVILIIIIIFCIISILLYFSIPLIINQLISLSKSIIPFIEQLFLKTTFINISYIEELLVKNINNFIFNLSNKPVELVIDSITLFTNFVLITILSIYFLFNMEKIKQKIKNLFNKNTKLLKCLREIDLSLNNYLRGLFIIIFIEMLEYTIIYLIVGHPNYLLLGILAGITTIIPYFGNLFTNILALITAISVSNELFIIVGIIVLIVPLIDCYIIDPKIYHKTTNLNPIKVIIAIIISSTIFGVIGIIIAVPIYLIIEALVKSIDLTNINNNL